VRVHLTLERPLSRRAISQEKGGTIWAGIEEGRHFLGEPNRVSSRPRTLLRGEIMGKVQRGGRLRNGSEGRSELTGCGEKGSITSFDRGNLALGEVWVQKPKMEGGAQNPRGGRRGYLSHKTTCSY